MRAVPSRRRSFAGWLPVFVLVLGACSSSAGTPAAESTAPLPSARAPAGAMTFADDLALLQQHGKPVVLSDRAGNARVIVSPDYQGRVMTSTAGGGGGASFGWINRAFIAGGERAPHMNAFGGEDRFWLGPEGGQYGLYFAPGAPFDFDHWQVPEPIDWGAWDVVSSGRDAIALSKDMQLTNYAGTHFTLHVDRVVRVIEPDAIATALSVKLPADVAVVGYESQNALKNTGTAGWNEQGGLLSIWILGMYNPSPATTIVIPFQPGSEAERGKIVNDAYFGKVPADRLVVGERVLFFRGDGRQRGKIGIPRPRAKPTLGAYDAAGKVLTLVQFTLPDDARDYVNSMWEQQAEPYAGDVVNSYNDGPPAPGKPPLGPFWEVETSSRAAELAPGDTLTHVHRTVHFTGPRASLDAIAEATLGVRLDEIERAFGSKP